MTLGGQKDGLPFNYFNRDKDFILYLLPQSVDCSWNGGERITVTRRHDGRRLQPLMDTITQVQSRMRCRPLRKQ